ncbi:MAG: histidine kinase [Candidatus Promineifilaceae bacterium]|jgi:signal transduction histidine kinase
MIRLVRATIDEEFSKLSRLTLAILILILVIQVIGSYILFTLLWGYPPVIWIQVVFVATILILSVGTVALYLLYRTRKRLLNQVNTIINDEIYVLQAAIERYEALQVMASTLSATLSFERVVEQAIQVCSLALEDLDIPHQSLKGVVFLFDGNNLIPLQIEEIDRAKILAGNEGVVGESLREGEPAVTDSPYQDPELKNFESFSDSLTVVSVPLRAGYQLFGVMLLGIDKAIRFEEKHFDLFTAVADQTVIALQNAQLYQRLEEEKQRLIEADSKARRELARDLHDGPVQKISVIAMHLNVLKPMAVNRPEKLPDELSKLEITAKNAAQELRQMLFTLRPLLLESKGLGPAIDSMLNQVSERDGIETYLVGGEAGEALNQQTQEVVFTIIEEALSNARKHARPSKFEVKMWQESDLFIARIADDGVGFDLMDVQLDYDTRGSLGLLNMQERAERIDGSLRIDSVPGLGTTITLVLPLLKNGVQEPLGLRAIAAQEVTTE